MREEWVCGCVCGCVSECVYMFAYVIKYLFAAVRYSCGISIGTNNLRKSSNLQWFICGLSCASCSLFLLIYPSPFSVFPTTSTTNMLTWCSMPNRLHTLELTHTHTYINKSALKYNLLFVWITVSSSLSSSSPSLSYCLLARSCLPVALVNKSRSVKQSRRKGVPH